MDELKNNEKTIRLLKTDNGVYFEVVYKYYFSPLYAYATQFVDNEDAKEVVQDTMLWLWENRVTLIEELSLKSLLLKNRIHEIIKEKYQPQFEDPDFYLESELFLLFQKALDNLPDPLRHAFELSRMDGLTHKEIAEKLGVSPQTINYRLGKALEILRSELKDYLPILLFLMV